MCCRSASKYGCQSCAAGGKEGFGAVGFTLNIKSEESRRLVDAEGAICTCLARPLMVVLSADLENFPFKESIVNLAILFLSVYHDYYGL